ncbi:MAG: hypothetical protein WB791_03860 [Waddliaceae bacterium]
MTRIERAAKHLGMTNKTRLANQLLAIKKRITDKIEEAPQCFVGFDGFTDEIIDAVETRTGPHDYQAMTEMRQFGQRINEFAGKSCNIELVVRQKKIGGNAPILTNALLEGGHRITFAGAIGKKEKIEPLFQEMADRCKRVFPLCPSGHSDALEFHDGKVILGKHASLIDINFSTLIKHIGKETLIQLLDETDLFVSANWTMLPLMTEIWHRIDEEIVPSLSPRSNERPRWLFVDLADPAKRTDSDMLEGLQALKRLSKAFRTILGLNAAEAIRVGDVLSSPFAHDGDSAHMRKLAQDIYQRSGLYEIIIHATHYAVAANEQEMIFVQGPYTGSPILATGAGDNFNAGVCNALLYQLSTEDALLSGVGTSGFYVRYAKSPTISELGSFLKTWEVHPEELIHE